MSSISINVPGAARYGRSANGATDARDEWWNRGNANAPQRNAVSGAIDSANKQAIAGPVGAQQDPRLAGNASSGAMGHQPGATGLAASLAAGTMPSQAAYQLQNGLNSASNQQRSLGASARGGAAIATAGSNAQANIADLRQNAYLQAGAVKANDMTQGRGMYGSMLGQQREQNAAQLGMGNEMSQGNAANADKSRLGMGGAAVGLGQAGVQQQGTQLGDFQQGMNPVNAQTQATQAGQMWSSSARKQAVNDNIQENT